MSRNKRKLGGAIYILPNLLTTGNMFFGFFSVVNSLQGDFKVAGASILLATVFDMLDGRVARLTNSTSEFGVQYDSLCDLISFGMAPAFLAYQFALHDLGRVGWLVCFFYLACGALRLARFNVQSSIGQGHDDFTGLPIPMAAAVIATMVLLVDNIAGGDLVDRFYTTGYVREWFGNEIFVKSLLSICTPGLGLVMVSNFRYRSHKSFKFSMIKPFKFLVLLIFLFSFVAFEPELFGFFAFGAYFISGPLEYILGWKKMTEEDDIFEAISGSSSMEPTGDEDE